MLGGVKDFAAVSWDTDLWILNIQLTVMSHNYFLLEADNKITDNVKFLSLENYTLTVRKAKKKWVMRDD